MTVSLFIALIVRRRALDGKGCVEDCRGPAGPWKAWPLSLGIDHDSQKADARSPNPPPSPPQTSPLGGRRARGPCPMGADRQRSRISFPARVGTGRCRMPDRCKVQPRRHSLQTADKTGFFTVLAVVLLTLTGGFCPTFSRLRLKLGAWQTHVSRGFPFDFLLFCPKYPLWHPACL